LEGTVGKSAFFVGIPAGNQGVHLVDDAECRLAEIH
jgi:hypothetical protein